MAIQQRMKHIVRPSSPRIHPLPPGERDAESRIQPRRAFSTSGLEELALVGTRPHCFRETDKRSLAGSPAASFLAPRQRAIVPVCIVLGSKSS